MNKEKEEQKFKPYNGNNILINANEISSILKICEVTDLKIDNLKKGLYLFQLNDLENNYSVIKKVIIE